MTQQLNALPTEPLLDESASVLARWNAPPIVRDWLVDLASERDPDLRANALYLGLRKQIGQPVFLDMLRGIIVAAVRNEYEGAAALTAFLGVRASGELLIRRVRDFSSLRRRRQRLRTQFDRDLERPDQNWLGDLDVVITRLQDCGATQITIRSEAPEMARIFSELFNGLIIKSDTVGVLDRSEVTLLRDLSLLELSALERRASELAGNVDPYSAEHMRRVVPLLAEIDADVRNLTDYLERVESEGNGRVLSEHVTVMSELLEDREEHQLRHALENTPELRLGWRLLRGLDRNPMPQRTLAWFTDRMLVVGQVLKEQRLRSVPMDIAACALCVLDHYRDGHVTVPASDRVIAALRNAGIENIELPDTGLTMVLDRERARRMPLPHGLPLPKLPLVNIEKYAEQTAGYVSVKDMVMSNLNNTSVLLGLLKNQKVINAPGVVALVAQRSRNNRVLETICSTRNLHSGFANKDVPLSILRSPMNIPIKTLRRFVSVRYISKLELKRLEVDRSAVRREVADEIRAYLRSLA